MVVLVLNMKFVDWFRQNMRTGFLQHELQNHNDAAKFYDWMLKYGCVAEESSTLAMRQGDFIGQGCSTVQMTGAKCQVVSRK